MNHDVLTNYPIFIILHLYINMFASKILFPPILKYHSSTHHHSFPTQSNRPRSHPPRTWKSLILKATHCVGAKIPPFFEQVIQIPLSFCWRPNQPHCHWQNHLSLPDPGGAAEFLSFLEVFPWKTKTILLDQKKVPFGRFKFHNGGSIRSVILLPFYQSANSWIFTWGHSAQQLKNTFLEIGKYQQRGKERYEVFFSKLHVKRFDSIRFLASLIGYIVPLLAMAAATKAFQGLDLQ